MFGIKMLAGIVGLSVILNGIAGAAHKTLLQQGIAEQVLRFHILANSDSEEDQAVKLKIRDTVLEWMETILEWETPAGTDKKQTVDFLNDHLDEIEELAEGVLQKNGFDYETSVQIQSCYFPDRTYRDCTFPAGWYDALRIELGEAEGENWWCVFYPRLCFADYLHVFSEKESTEQINKDELERLLTVEEYDLLLRNPKEWKIGFRWF